MTHQKKFELEIGIESSDFPSDFNSSLPFRHKHFQTQTQHQSIPHCELVQLQSRLKVQNPPDSSTSHQNPKETLFQNEPLSNNSSTHKKNPFSMPHKRPVMSQTPSSLSHSSSLSTLRGNRNTPAVNSGPTPRSFRCPSSLAIVSLIVKAIAFRIFCRSCRVRWLQLHLRIVILLSLPFLYVFTSYHYYTIIFHSLLISLFCGALLIAVNFALPYLPSIRSIIARSSLIKFCPTTVTASEPRSPVVWSIGSKKKSERRPLSGYWVQVYSNGDVFEGEFHKGKCSGSGVYYYYMSGRYEGDWIDGKYDGCGVETWAKGSRYRGQYRQGLRHGFGVYRFYTGDVYSGEWCNGQCHGCGVYTCEDGSWYFGEFKWGVKHGLGHYHFRNGDTYAGEYFADKMHGFGVYQFANGHVYEGAWHEGRRQGLGKYTFRNGEMQLGHWQNGVLNVSSTHGALPGSSPSNDHSKILNAIQEARRAAEKAASMPEVDERVNKAVAAANKAANAARVAAVKAVQSRAHHNSDIA